jgi:hypothetical protein
MNNYELVPELKEWDAHNGDEMSPEGWVACMGTYSHAVSYASLIWPQFVEIKGMIFRDDVSESNVDHWLSNPTRSKKEVEAMLNHLHILDIQHPGIWSTATATQIRYLGETLRASWEAKLALDFPNRRFSVEYFDSETDDLSESQVLFYEIRD